MSSISIIATKWGEDERYELIEYGITWRPWTHCVRRIIPDGKHFQRSGQETCTGVANFESEAKAREHFNTL